MRILISQRDEGPKIKSRFAEKLSEKSYKRIEKFAGGEANWQDWKYDFEILTGALNKDVARELGDQSQSPNRGQDMISSNRSFLRMTTGNLQPEARSYSRY